MPTVKEALQGATRTQLRAAILKSRFDLFVREAWNQVCAEPLVWELPQHVTSLHLQAIQDGKFPDNHTLTISVPPGQSKSLLTSVLYPAWVWTRNPSHSFICATHTSALTQRFASRFRALVESEWFQGLWQVKFTDDTNSKLAMRNTFGGERLGVSVGGSITGSHADTHVCDDLVDASDASNSRTMEAANEWYDQVLSTRAKNANKLSSIVIAQRLSMGDIVQHVKARPSTIHLSLPAVLSGPPCVTPVWTDTRSPGQLLAPLRLPQAVLDSRKTSLGSMAFSAQYQQSPVPAGGGWIKREWFSQRHSLNQIPGSIQTPSNFDKITIVVDASVKGNPDSDRVCAIVAGIKNHTAYILDAVWARMDWGNTMAAVKAAKMKWRATEIALEDKANGSPLITEMRTNPIHNMGCPIIALQANAPKPVRIQTASTYIEGQSIVLPANGFQSTSMSMNEFLDEVCAYPKAPDGHDDAPDALAHLVARYCAHTTTDKYAAMAALQSLQGR